MESTKPMLPAALKAGVYLAIAGIIIFIIEYVADIKPVGILRPIIIMLVSFAIIITMLVFLLKKYRTDIGGYISFGNAFLFCLLAFVASTILSTAFTYLFMNYFDPMYMQHVMQAQKDFMENYLSGKVSDEQLAKTLQQIDEQAAKANSLMQTIKQMSFGLIFGVIISLILGAIMKRNPALFDNSSTGGVI
jgi:hypothetical protein